MGAILATYSYANSQDDKNLINQQHAVTSKLSKVYPNFAQALTQENITWEQQIKLGEYTDNGDGTITDNVTGLMWERSPYKSKKFTWKQAMEGLESFNDLHLLLDEPSF